jgi:NADPH:quinone reductase-like Zn-dependent oxidoreductase
MAIGRKLVEAGQLDQADDVMFLRYNELRTLIGQADVVDARALVKARRAEHEAAWKVTPRDWVGTVTPSQLAFPYLVNWGYPERFHRAAGTDSERIEGIAGSPGVIEIGDVPAPVPGPGDVLVRVHAATVNRTDCGELLHPNLIGLLSGRRSRRAILGMDFAGIVEAVGVGAGRFKPGDRVFGICPFSGNGAQAEYLCMAETGPIAAMPANLRFDQAVLCEGAYYANASVEQLGYRPGHKILIYGASGAIGTAALQLAKLRGAEVVAVVAGRHLDLARSLGADLAIDYATDAFDRLGRDFDVVFDAVGKLGNRQWRRLLKPGGVFATTDLGPRGQYLFPLLWSKLRGNGRVVVPLPPRGSAPGFVADLKNLIEAGRYVPVLDRIYPLDAIADAYRYVQTGQKAGVVVIEIVTDAWAAKPD